MLHLLVNYSNERLDAEPGFVPKDVRWAVICEANGKFLEVVELGDTDQRRNPGRAFAKCPDLTQQEMVRGGETKSHFLAETAEVFALWGKNAGDEKIKKKHGYFVELLREASGVMPELEYIADLLTDETAMEDIRSALEERRAKAGDKVTFRIDEAFPLESDLWHDWWRSFRKNLSEKKPKKAGAEKSAPLMRCFVTGELVEPIPTHFKIKNLSDVGGLPTGDVLVGFDKDSFRSYGLAQSANAALSEEAASAYRAALNHLLKESGQRLAGAKVVHWFKKKVAREDDPLFWLQEGAGREEMNAQELARKTLDGLRTGKRHNLLGNHYYALTISGASGRVMVRDWMDGQFEELVENIVGWFDDLCIVHRSGMGEAPAPKFLAVLGATVRDLGDLAPPLVSKMWRTAVRGEPIPQFALAQALIRARVDIIGDQPFNHARMGLMKAYHLRKNRRKGVESMDEESRPYLNENHPDPAYHCGRLMAVLAGVQHAALGDVGAGLVQRYYAAASATPALVLGRLARASQFHLGKLRPGLAHWYEDKIASIWVSLGDAVPSTLDLERQSLFALGYYQQLADLRKKSAGKNNEEEENNE